MGRAIAWALLGLISGCGRIGYDAVSVPDAPVAPATDAPRSNTLLDARVADTAAEGDAAADAPGVDAPAVDRPPDQPVEASAPCFQGWMTEPVGRHCYAFLGNVAMPWESARVNCLAFGGHLVTISSAAEQAFVLGLRQQRGADLWIGLSQVGTGPFRWVTGEPLSFTAWVPGMPDDGRDAYGRIALDGWHDTAAREQHVGLCEYEP